MLHETMSHVSMLHINRSSQLHAAVASRHRDVRDIYIYSLIQFREDPHNGEEIERRVDADTATRVIPFLCHFGPKLERVFLGGQRTNGGLVEGYVPAQHTLDEDSERMKTLINAFSGAFRSGALSRNTWVLGLHCPNSSRFRNMFMESSCLVCHNACNSFPLETVINFECEGSSLKYHNFLRPYYPDQIYGLDVCLNREQIESIVKERPGGRDMLYSETRFMSLLGRGTHYIIVPDEGEELYVVKYDEEELGDIQRFIKKSHMDVAKLSSDTVTGAIKRSFAEDERDPLPPRDKCYLAENSFHELKDMGLPIDESDFLNGDEWDGKKCKSARSIMNYSYNWRFT